MAISIKSTGRSVVTLNLPRAVPALIAYTENVVKRMTGTRPSQAPHRGQPSLAGDSPGVHLIAP